MSDIQNPDFTNWPCFVAVLDGVSVAYFMVQPDNEMALAAWRSNPTIVETVWSKVPYPGSKWNGSFTEPDFTPEV